MHQPPHRPALRPSRSTGGVFQLLKTRERCAAQQTSSESRYFLLQIAAYMASILLGIVARHCCLLHIASIPDLMWWHWWKTMMVWWSAKQTRSCCCRFKGQLDAAGDDVDPRRLSGQKELMTLYVRLNPSIAGLKLKATQTTTIRSSKHFGWVVWM